MPWRHLLRSFALVVAVTAGATTATAQTAAQPAPGTPTFRASVDLVPVTAVVRDGRGRTLRGLQPHDFVVLERGRPRTVADFKAGDQGPVSLAILMDTSGSMRVGRQLAASRDAVEHVLTWIDAATDEIGLFSFDQTLRLEVPFTKDSARIREGVARLDGLGTTSLYDAIAATAKVLDQRPSPRRAVIVVTDGMDTSSTLTPGPIPGLASAIDVPVYVIALLSPLDHPGTDYAVPSSIGSIVSTQLTNLCVWTGGDLMMASAPAHVSAAVRDLLTQLRHQYVLTFESASQAGWYDLEVRVRQKDAVVRARSGYFAGGTRETTDGQRSVPRRMTIATEK
jgi:Ca-activated chloride channel homolog